MFQRMDIIKIRVSSTGEVANVLDCDLEVNKIEIPSGYYVHFRIGSLGKCMKLLILEALV